MRSYPFTYNVTVFHDLLVKNMERWCHDSTVIPMMGFYLVGYGKSEKGRKLGYFPHKDLYSNVLTNLREYEEVVVSCSKGKVMEMTKVENSLDFVLRD